MLSSEQNPERSVATDDHSSTAAGPIKNQEIASATPRKFPLPLPHDNRKIE